ncbi:hypothetical protein BC939DRAFT_532584 [Gamsiella multidivaricata]|uniref:uncharacterized protein n=1 Tax=Gamsiella multidivaricata TaxID=101098 RepID=UPI0022211B7F|nr:uncharacterized protein BC939DRAFT_532584 [Gamsiella multidivaricata]KAG0371003.1 antigen identified by monoclonal antibody Ki-67 [Gamsiella multidivaricata]KAI7817667.1 hypothetical protein BC939DRAFT_532584 [Gamsiella multidivaricata]
MSETPKRRLLRKSALQASPFGTPVKSFHNFTPTAGSTTTATTPVKPASESTTVSSLSNPFVVASSSSPNATSDKSTESAESTEIPTSPQDINSSPSSRKSARLSALYGTQNTNSNGNSSSGSRSSPRKLVPPTTPKSKTVLKLVWGYIVGLRKMDESEYYRYPIDKSYCSFGRNSTNDVRVQIDTASEIHCKLIRRDDGEVWLKDTSTNGTLLNNVLVHDTARPIQHNDVMTIAGRKFRFESAAPIPRTSLQLTSSNTPGRQISSIQSTIDRDILALAEMPSPTARRSLSTPKRDTARSGAALESTLGLFTPNRAAKLSSLLVSPKPVPFPAFLSKSPMKTATPRKIFTMIDEPSVLNPTCANSSLSPPLIVRELDDDDDDDDDDEPGLHTPTKQKRKAHLDLEEGDMARTPKKVSFGPALSPEVFDKAEPPSTPIKRGQQQGPETPRRRGISTPSLLSKLSALTPTPKPILTPTRIGGRTAIFHDLKKPAPLKLFELDEDIPKKPQFVEMNFENEKEISADASGTCVADPVALDYQDEASKSVAQDVQLIDDAQNSPLDVEADNVREDREQGQDETIEDSGTSSDSSSGSSSEDGLWKALTPLPSIEDDICLPVTPTRRLSDKSATPVQQRPSTPFQSTPGSASRLALLQLSAQKIHGLADLLQGPSTPTISRENSDSLPTTPTRPPVKLPLFDENGRGQMDGAQEEHDHQDVEDWRVDQEKTDKGDLKRRSSAPATVMVDPNQSPIFSGFRGVFRTPQKVVESCFAGFAGFRDYVMSPTRSSHQRPLLQRSLMDEFAAVDSHKDNNEDEPETIESSEALEAPEKNAETLDVQQRLVATEDDTNEAVKKEADSIDLDRTSVKRGISESPEPAITPKRRIASHQDVLTILMGYPRESSPKSKDFSFAKEHSLLSPAKSLDEIRSRRRRSDIFPQKRTIAIRSHSQNAEGRDGTMDEKEVAIGVDGKTRRRTISLFDFKQEQFKSGSVALVTTTYSESTSAMDSEDKTEASAQQSRSEKQIEEDAEQAELLRLLGEGSGSLDDDEEEEAEEVADEEVEEEHNSIIAQELEESNIDPSSYEVPEEAPMSTALMDDKGSDQAIDGDLDQDDKENRPSIAEVNTAARRISSSYKSRENTPTKRRHSLKQRLGSASPAFRLYEGQFAEEEEEEENEDDMVMMISPKRVRVHSFLE